MTDPQMMTWAYEFPTQLRSALTTAETAGWGMEEQSLPSDTSMFVAGMGGSGAAGRLAGAVLAAAGLERPVWIQSDPSVPDWIGSSSPTGLISYSGNTWETLAAYDELRRRQNRPWVVTSGGELLQRAEADGCPVFTIPTGYAPRAALGWMLIPVLLKLAGKPTADLYRKLHLAADELSAEMETWRRGQFEPRRDPDALGRQLVGKVAWVYGCDARMSTVAYRWKTQIEENMKQFAVSGAFPEVAHNEIEGWEHGRADSLPLLILLEGSPDLSSDTRNRGIAAAGEEMRPLGLEPLTIPALGEDPLVQLLSQVQFVDVATLRGAHYRGVDPDPVEALTRVKGRIGRV